MPVVCVDFWPVYSGADGVVVDCFAEAHQAVNFLVDSGHQELFFAGNTVGRGPQRQAELDSLFMETGYRHATQTAGLARSADRICYCRYDEPESLVEWFLGLKSRPTAGIIFSSETPGPRRCGDRATGRSLPAGRVIDVQEL